MTALEAIDLWHQAQAEADQLRGEVTIRRRALSLIEATILAPLSGRNEDARRHHGRLALEAHSQWRSDIEHLDACVSRLRDADREARRWQMVWMSLRTADAPAEAQPTDEEQA